MAGTGGTGTGGSSGAPASGGDREHGSASNACSGPANNTALVVQIERSDGKKLTKPADVRIEGPSSRTEKTAEGTDRVTFKPVNAGKYKVSVKPNGEEDEFAALPPHPQEVVVAQGEEKLATLKIAPPLKAYLHFTFTDPDDKVRDFPKDFKVVLVYNDGSEVSAVLNEKGVGESGGSTVGIPVDRSKIDFTLSFSSNGSEYIVCEKAGDTVSGEIGGASRLVDGKRGFMLPKDKWTLGNSDWEVTNAATYAEHKFTKLDDPNTEIGTAEKPVELKLTCHWQYHKFIYFDRKFGPTDHKARISVPAIPLEGYRKAPDNSTIKPDTAGNWTTGTDAKDMKQALPWILQREEDGATPLPKLNKDMELRFKTDTGSGNYVFSKSATERELKALAGSADELKPGPERLACYDLPSLWRSRAYYTRKAGGTDGKFFYDLTESDIEAANTKTTPLIFCLDDIVLYADGTSGLVQLDPLADTDKVVIFHHKFDNTDTSCTAQGVYKTLPFAEAADATELPSSKVEIKENYLTDYADWTRLIIAQGNLFDVFETRTPDSTEEKRAVGARAAVRWVDAMEPLVSQGFALYNFATSSAEPSGKPLPGYAFFSSSYSDQKRPGPTDRPFFAMQHFFSQRTANRYGEAYHESKDELTGRFDIALLRCCGIEDGKEVAVNLHYLKSYFKFNAAPPVTEQQYAHDLSVNTCNRWNGNDPGVNESRARFVPRSTSGGSASTLQPLLVDVVWFCQSVMETRAHYLVKVENIDRANRNGQSGTGQSGPNGHTVHGAPASFPHWFPTAHESGHMDALPDEYNEQWNSASYNQVSLKCNLPADPYRLDEAGGGAMMNKNEVIRNRYFWHAAEWARRRIGGDIHLKVVLEDRGGTKYDDYHVPEHGDAHRTYAFWPLQADLKPDAPQPVLPASARGGLRDLFLYTLGKDHYSQAILPELEDPPGASPYDGILAIIVKVAFDLEKWTDPATNKDKRAQLLQAAINGADIFNHAWYATGKAPIPGSAPAAEYTFTRCLIQFSPRVVVSNHIEDGETAAPVDPADPQPTEHGHLAMSVIQKLKLHYCVEVEEADPPATRWVTGVDVPDLESGDDFLNKVPDEAKTETIMQELKTKLDEYHGIDAFHLTDRIAKVREIQIQAESFLEPSAAVDATWGADTSASISRAPSAKTDIDQAMGLYRSTGSADYGERLIKLRTVKGLMDGFAESVNVKGTWRAHKNTTEVDAALVLYQDLPTESYDARINALGALQTACDAFVTSTRKKVRLFNLGLYGLIPGVEGLSTRARDKKGEIALARGISVMKPKVEQRLKDLAILKGLGELKQRSKEVKKNLEARESSVTLRIEYNNDAAMLNTVRDDFGKYFLSMLGIHKLPNELTRDDLIPLVKKVIPVDTDVQPV